MCILKCHGRLAQSHQEKTGTPGEGLRIGVQAQIGQAAREGADSDLPLQAGQRRAKAVEIGFKTRSNFMQVPPEGYFSVSKQDMIFPISYSIMKPPERAD
jgi:hypothetical protein